MAEQSSSREKAPKAQPPITRHKLFPAIAALWGATLLGVVGLVLSAAFLKAALPTIGQLGLAIALALVGSVLGLRFGRKAGAVRSVAAPRTASVAPAPVDTQPAALELPPETEPEDISLAFVPVTAPPPTSRPVLDVADFAAAYAPAEETGRSSLAIEPRVQPEPEEVALPPVVAPPSAAAVPVAASPAGKAARRLVSADLGALSDLELIERLALALQRWRSAGGAVPIAPPAGLFEAADPAPEAGVALPAALVPAAPSISPVAASFVRSLPGGAAADPQDTEAALRNALASLRQMSGAA